MVQRSQARLSPSHPGDRDFEQGSQPGPMETHRLLARASVIGRHLIAGNSAHWIQFDEPELIAAAVRQLVDDSRK